MAEGQGKLQKKAAMLLPNSSPEHLSLYNLLKLSCQVQYKLFLIRLTGAVKVMGRKRQSSRNHPQDESSNRLLRGNYFDFFELKKKKKGGGGFFQVVAKRNNMSRQQTTLGYRQRNKETFTFAFTIFNLVRAKGYSRVWVVPVTSVSCSVWLVSTATSPRLPLSLVVLV